MSDHPVRPQLRADAVALDDLSAILATIVQELNQPLTAITAYLEAVRRLLDADAPVPHDKIQAALAKATAQVTRAADISRRLSDAIRLHGIKQP